MNILNCCNFKFTVIICSVNSVADLSLNEIRRLYFELKNEVFVNKIGGVLLPDQQTEVLEGILKREVGEQTKLGSRTHPKYYLWCVNCIVYRDLLY